MGRRLSCSVVVALAAMYLAVSASAAVPAGTFSGCPRSNVLALQDSATVYGPGARAAVLHFVHTSFARVNHTPTKQLVGARTMQVLLVRNWLPSGWIRSECGVTIWQRSIAVGVYFPAMDLPHNPVGRCNDCDHITFVASKTEQGWTVWGIY